MKEYFTNATKTAATLRLVVGGYLLYLDYSVFDYAIHKTGIERIILLLILLLFLIAGGGLIIFSIMALVKGFLAERRPEDPGKDPEENPGEEKTEEASEPEETVDTSKEEKDDEEPRSE
ncbi:MAG: hypothetical protein K6F53_01915 [Lachnospiraceae bacterium]|nr:hypothetical protein [Lachnospiraceae bacterium]